MSEATEGPRGETPDLAKLSEQVVDLIVSREHEQAAALIESARQRLPPDKTHRVLALEAVLKRESGDLVGSIRLLQRTREEKPEWLAHLYSLAVLLMDDAERWLAADLILDELIRLSESKDDHYFLNEARFRKILCLRALGRDEGIGALKAKLAPDTRVFIGSGSYSIDDLDGR
jgi:hypothetical protein